MSYDYSEIQQIGQQYEDALRKADEDFAVAVKLAQDRLRKDRRSASIAYDKAANQLRKEGRV